MSLELLLLVRLVVSNTIGILHEQNNHNNIRGITNVKIGPKKLHLSVNSIISLEIDKVTLKRI